jgi:hypothetical protein
MKVDEHYRKDSLATALPSLLQDRILCATVAPLPLSKGPHSKQEPADTAPADGRQLYRSRMRTRSSNCASSRTGYWHELLMCATARPWIILLWPLTPIPQPSRTWRPLTAAAVAGTISSQTPRPAVRSRSAQSGPAIFRRRPFEVHLNRACPLHALPASERRTRSLRAQLTQLFYTATLSVRRMHNRPPKVKTVEVVVVVPAHNEQESIARTIKALLSKTRQSGSRDLTGSPVSA